MSADNWRQCPQCNATQLADKEKAKKKADSSYGKVPQEEYLKLLEIANQPIRLAEHLREDYSVYVDLDGEFRVSYSCSCDKCPFNYSYSHTEKVKLK
jgi:hypothetical protein